MSVLNSRGRGRLPHSLMAVLPVFLLMICCSSLAPAQIPDVPGWDLVWNDEFDGISLDNSKWTALDRRDSFNNEKQYYHPDQVSVTNGNLELTAIDVPRAGKAYQSGLITSNDLFGPGRFEARIDLPTSQGMWPAFWLNANHVPWPLGGEIDIMENRGSEPHITSSAYHWQTDPGPCCDQHEYVLQNYSAWEGGQPVDFHAGFHTYTAEWDETTVRYYVDGNLYHVVTETANRPIYETPKNIIVNLAVGGFFGGDPDGSTVWPQTMYVDYVRYWQPEGAPDPDPETGTNLLTNASFDASGGSLGGWSLFGNSIPNVSADSGLAIDGTTSMKVFGQFSGSSNSSGASQGVAISGGETLRAISSTHSPSWDTLFGKSNEVSMKIEFYSVFGGNYGTSDFLGEEILVIHDGSTPDNIWHNHELEVIAPEGAAEARLTFLFNQPNNQNGAVWIDATGLFIDTLAGDFDLDGDVDNADLLAWQRNPSLGSLADWEANYGAPSNQSATAAVPEPGSSALLLAGFGCLCRRNRSSA